MADLSMMLKRLRESEVVGTFGHYNGRRAAGQELPPILSGLSDEDGELVTRISRQYAPKQTEATILSQGCLYLVQHSPEGPDHKGTQWGFSVRRLALENMCGNAARISSPVDTEKAAGTRKLGWSLACLVLGCLLASFAGAFAPSLALRTEAPVPPEKRVDGNELQSALAEQAMKEVDLKAIRLAFADTPAHKAAIAQAIDKHVREGFADADFNAEMSRIIDAELRDTLANLMTPKDERGQPRKVDVARLEASLTERLSTHVLDANAAGEISKLLKERLIEKIAESIRTSNQDVISRALKDSLNTSDRLALALLRNAELDQIASELSKLNGGNTWIQKTDVDAFFTKYKTITR